MRAVIDCNIFVSAVSSKSKYHVIVQKLIKGDFHLLLSTEVYFEYYEIISAKYQKYVADAFIGALENSPFVIPCYPGFHWNLIYNDPDDNKYIDLYVAGNADYLVTDDRDFKFIRDIKFPFVNVIGIDAFLGLLNAMPEAGS
jgi:putative PIN family toxin of toxin-antitoxin system